MKYYWISAVLMASIIGAICFALGNNNHPPIVQTSDDVYKKYGLSPEPYTPPTQIQNSETDLGGLMVTMPATPTAQKATKVLPNGSMTLHVFDSKNSHGYYFAAEEILTPNDDAVWEPNKAIDGGIEGALANLKNEGYTYRITSDKYVTVAGLRGRSVSGVAMVGKTAMTFYVMDLVELAPRAYVFVAVSEMNQNEDALKMFSSIRRK